MIVWFNSKGIVSLIMCLIILKSNTRRDDFIYFFKLSIQKVPFSPSEQTQAMCSNGRKLNKKLAFFSSFPPLRKDLLSFITGECHIF